MYLAASLRSVSIAGEQIDLQGYQGENLGGLLVLQRGVRGGLPRFDVEVSSGPGQDQPQGHPHQGYGMMGKPMAARGSMGAVGQGGGES